MDDPAKYLGYVDKAIGSLLRLLPATSMSASQASFHIRESICQFQLDYANYHHECASRHQEFKKAYTDKQANVGDLYKDLESYASKMLNNLVGTIYGQVDDYFKFSREYAGCAANISIHLYNRELDKIYRYLPKPRDPSNPVYRAIDEFTAFKYVDIKGLPYLCNFTPYEIKNNLDYKYGDVDCSGIRDGYKVRYFRDSKIVSRASRKLFKNSRKDSSWRELVLLENSGDREAFKSHLVVPITFTGHLDKSHLNEKIENILNLEASGRSILGFIIVDHEEPYFFDDSPVNREKNIDVNMLYIYADLISLFIVCYMNFIDSSKTVNSFEAGGV